MQQKPLGDLSEEELLELIKFASLEERVSPVPSILDHERGNVEIFLGVFGIQYGEKAIPARILWNLYKHWTREKITSQEFYRKLTLLLPEKKQIQNQQHYLINLDTFKISKEIYNLINRPKKTHKKQFQQKSFEDFVKMCNIVDGKTWITSDYLFKLYKSNNKLTVGRTTFNRFLKLYFDYREITELEVAIDKENMKEIFEKKQTQTEQSEIPRTKT